MKSILTFSTVVLILLFVFVACESDPQVADYIGTWLCNGTFLFNLELPDTTNITNDMISTLNADMTFTLSGTSTVEGSLTVAVEADGTYTVDEGAGTMDFVYLNYSEDGTPKDYDMPIVQYYVQGDTLTLTWPAGLDYSPGEPLVYTRQ